VRGAAGIFLERDTGLVHGLAGDAFSGRPHFLVVVVLVLVGGVAQRQHHVEVGDPQRAVELLVHPHDLKELVRISQAR